MAILSRLRARCFRNLVSVDLDLHRGINFLEGANGQGKSNVLEAICYLGLLRSFRTHGVVHLRQWDADSFSLRGSFSDPDPAYSFELEVTQGERRGLAVNGSPVARASDFINAFICVPLVPEDIELVKGSAAGRRRFLDIVISQKEPLYLQELQRYRDALKQRNALLRQGQGVNRAVLASYEDIMLVHGVRVEIQRRRYVRQFDACLRVLSDELFGKDSGFLSAAYMCPGISRDSQSNDSVQEDFRCGLARCRERDAREGNTTVGPHRADLVMHLGGRSVSAFCSEGECRMVSLAMRIASLRLVLGREEDHRGIVVLIDDVFGELDSERAARFFAAVGQTDQLVVTATEVPAQIAANLATHYLVKEGKVASK